MNLADLIKLGIAVSAREGQLHLKAAPGVITPEFANRVRAAKPKLLRELAQQRNGEQSCENVTATIGSAESDPSKATDTHHALSFSDETRIRAWLARIGETDAATIAEVMDGCRMNPEVQAYFLARSDEGSGLPARSWPEDGYSKCSR